MQEELQLLTLQDGMEPIGFHLEVE